MNNKRLCFLLLVITLVSCSAISAADTNDINTTSTVITHTTEDITQSNTQLDSVSEIEYNTNSIVQSNDKNSGNVTNQNVETKNSNTNNKNIISLNYTTKSLKSDQVYITQGNPVSSENDITGSGTYYLTQNITWSSSKTINGNFVLYGNGYSIIGNGNTNFLYISGTNNQIHDVIITNMTGVVIDIETRDTLMNITNTQFINNTANQIIHLQGQSSAMNLTNVLFENNTIIGSDNSVIYSHTHTYLNATAVSFVNNKGVAADELISQQNNQHLYLTNVYYISSNGTPRLITDLSDIISKPNTNIEGGVATFYTTTQIDNVTVYAGNEAQVTIVVATNIVGLNVPYANITYQVGNNASQRVTTAYDGSITINVDTSHAGTITIISNYDGLTLSNGTTVYHSSTGQGTITVLERPTSIIATDIIGTMGSSTSTTVTVTDIENKPVNEGTVSLIQNDMTIATIDLSQTNIIQFTPTTSGTDSYKLIYNGVSGIYNSSNVTIKGNITKRNSTTSASVVNNTAGNVIVDVSVVDTVTGNVIPNGNVTILDNDGNIVGNGSIIDGKSLIVTNITQTGVYSLNVSYGGNENYLESSTTINNITVVGRDTHVDVVITNNTVGNTTINVTVIDSETNKTIPDADVVVTLPNGTNITGKTDENGSVIIPIDIPSGNNNITVTYVGNETYNETSTTVNIDVNKINSIIIVDPIIGVIGENITLTAHVTDEYGNSITGGNLVFKLNGKTLRSDGSFNSTATPLKCSVINGTVTYTLTADLYLRNAKNLSASYSGSNKYTENTSNITTAQIAKRRANITVTTVNLTKQDTDIELTATLSDVTRNGTNTTAINEGYVVFKVNGVSLKDMDGNIIRVKVENNTAKYTYHVPVGMASVDGQGNLRNYTVEAVYQSDIFYPDARDSTTFNVEKSNITLNINNVIINNTTKTITSITGNITDYNGNLVVGTNKVCVKVNGKTLTDSRNRTIYFTVTNGIINITNINTTGIKSFNSITIVTGERQAYTDGRTTTTQLIIV
ncbi:beta strand repeat-containing protein [Methanosphaera sp.]